MVEPIMLTKIARRHVRHNAKMVDPGQVGYVTRLTLCGAAPGDEDVTRDWAEEATDRQLKIKNVCVACVAYLIARGDRS